MTLLTRTMQDHLGSSIEKSSNNILDCEGEKIASPIAHWSVDNISD